ncbi:hypothetical protein GQX74_014340 [Glossina fuscipes]|nr:hypothetical protein GQX74_014340 [Glossina fuscipes]
MKKIIRLICLREYEPVPPVKSSKMVPMLQPTENIIIHRKKLTKVKYQNYRYRLLAQEYHDLILLDQIGIKIAKFFVKTKTLGYAWLTHFIPIISGLANIKWIKTGSNKLEFNENRTIVRQAIGERIQQRTD